MTTRKELARLRAIVECVRVAAVRAPDRAALVEKITDLARRQVERGDPAPLVNLARRTAARGVRPVLAMTLVARCAGDAGGSDEFVGAIVGALMGEFGITLEAVESLQRELAGGTDAR